MATNYPSPYVLQYTTTTQGIISKFKIACQVLNNPTPGTTFTDIEVTTKDGGSVFLWLGIETFLGLVKASFQAVTVFSGIELFKVQPNNAGLQFISAYDFSISGDSGQAWTPTHYSIFGFRTANGSTMRITYLEPANAGDSQLSYPDIPLWEQNMVDYVLSDDSWLYGADDSYPIAFLRRSQGQNEAIWRKRNRPNS